MNKPNAVVIHPSHAVWEVWSAGSQGVESAFGRDMRRGTFERKLDAERFAKKLNETGGGM